MTDELYEKLVDFYAGEELPQELQEEIEMAALRDPELGREMSSLKITVGLLQDLRQTPIDPESDQRIKALMCARGLDTRPQLAASPLQMSLLSAGIDKGEVRL